MKYLNSRQSTTRYGLVFAIVVLPFVSVARSETVGQDDSPFLKWELLARDHSYVTPLSVSAPQGRLVLVRHAGDLCAIRFDNFHRGGDKKAPTTFNSGAETLFATAEEIQLSESESQIRILKRKTINLVRGPVVGLGRLGLQTGQIGLRCGDTKLEWTYPNNISLGSYTENSAKRVQIEMAVTAWSEVPQINLGDERLRWYRYDESRKDTVIPIKDLPGS